MFIFLGLVCRLGSMRVFGRICVMGWGFRRERFFGFSRGFFTVILGWRMFTRGVGAW